MPTITAQHLEMIISDWRYPRHVIIDGDKVEMEIARTHCSHCPTCRSRINHVERALAGKRFRRRSAGGGEYFILSLPKKAARDPQAIADFLGRRMRLAISPADC